ncbi:phosphatidylinositol-specific phospholipase C domain-containing protein [Bacterioplanoides sp.]|uniref:phosphatidylinositol-specific phospholipase C domain-containing protein n=1 Tax=Bacterioplanoides sp. TaxID=2066072 RepID=UPI003B5A71ED
MNKKMLLSTALLGAAVSFSPATTAHTDGAYAHEAKAVASNPSWMKFVDGNKRISELSIPGTHDTMSIKSGVIWQNQTMTLSQQLESGIRVFDMRTRHINNKFRMHHGIIAQDTYFDDVLKDIDAFLTANPSETVLFRLRSEHTAEGNSRSYSETLDEYLAANGSKRYTGSSDNPTLNEVRGKFVILQEFGGADYGIPYGNLDIQDEYKFTTNWDLYDKWTSVKNHLNKSRNGDKNTIYMNYLSGAGGSFPYFVASGHFTNSTNSARLSTGFTTPGWKNKYPDFPRTSCFIGICTISFEGTNTLTADHMVTSGFLNGGARAGMVMADFPGERLINNTIRLNHEGPYQFTEFNWGTGTDQNTPLCNGSSPCVEGDKFASAPPAAKDSLTVVSYNVLRAGPERIQNQINWLKNKFGVQGPDVILLSETVRGSSCGADVAREYAKAFNAYYINGNEDSARSCQTGNAIVSRYPLGNVEKIRFKTQHGDLSGTSETSSGRSYVVADLKVGDDIVHVFSTHTASPFGIAGDKARKGQHAEIIAHAEAKRFTKIVGGDLNAIGHIFADPLGLHDISLNPIFERGYKDAHDHLPTHTRITSEAGLADNDWTLLLDFIFVKGGSTSGAGVCGSECRDKNTLSDHVPIWASVNFKANAAAPTDADLATMEVGDQYSFKLNTTDNDGEQCRLEWNGSLDDGERNAKWDCASNGDPMTMQILTKPTLNSQGNYQSRVKIYTLNGGCGLQWAGGDTDGGERNAKFDCDPATDDMIITSRSALSPGQLDKAIITTAANNCGLQWDAGKSGNERNAKFDCDPAWDTVNFMNVSKQFSGYKPLTQSGYQTPIQSTYGCDSGDSRCNQYLEFGGSDARIGGDLTQWEMLPADNSGSVFFLRNKWNCDSDNRCDDWLTYSDSSTDVVINAADAEMVPWLFEPVAGKADTYYIRTRWGCEVGDSRCNYYLTFSGTDVIIHPTDKVEWKLPKQYRELRDQRSDKCLDISGSTVEERDSVFIYNCAGVDWQKWNYDPMTGLLRNKANPSMCLDHRGKFSDANGEYVHMWTCYDWSTNQKWDFVNGALQPRGSQGPVLDATGSANDAPVVLWQKHGGSNQQWHWGNP